MYKKNYAQMIITKIAREAIVRAPSPVKGSEQKYSNKSLVPFGPFPSTLRLTPFYFASLVTFFFFGVKFHSPFSERSWSEFMDDRLNSVEMENAFDPEFTLAEVMRSSKHTLSFNYSDVCNP